MPYTSLPLLLDELHDRVESWRSGGDGDELYPLFERTAVCVSQSARWSGAEGARLGQLATKAMVGFLGTRVTRHGEAEVLLATVVSRDHQAVLIDVLRDVADDVEKGTMQVWRSHASSTFELWWRGGALTQRRADELSRRAEAALSAAYQTGLLHTFIFRDTSRARQSSPLTTV